MSGISKYLSLHVHSRVDHYCYKFKFNLFIGKLQGVNWLFCLMFNNISFLRMHDIPSYGRFKVIISIKCLGILAIKTISLTITNPIQVKQALSQKLLLHQFNT